jgi:hypothetical protein
MSGDAPALMSAWTERKWPSHAAWSSAVDPCLCPGRGGVGWPRGYPTSLPVTIPYRLRPRGYPLSFFVFRRHGG